jgi:hypothetical protein
VRTHRLRRRIHALQEVVVRALDAEERARALADENGELRLELRRCARALDPVSPRPKRIPPHRPIL